ncbi:hypothetical protein AB0K51_05140 [Kitasatospora sp. NPDC049285]|uniref:terpene synthase family protein n=1 Tax=Kitasatospora sp. NPDC049285 TaxID=3157096 RepID=UPI00344300CB
MAHTTEPALPFERRRSPDEDAARRANTAWLSRQRLIPDDAAMDRYLGWNLAELAARSYPDARGDDLTLGLDVLSLFFLFDDQFDSPLGADPGATARICRTLTGVLDADRAAADAAPMVHAFADLWQRSRRGMTADWQRRAADHWRSYFLSHVVEADNRRTGGPLTVDRYLELRRDTVGILPCVDLGERIQHYRMPERAYRAAEFSALLGLATELVGIANDVFSVGKEAALGDPHNLVLVLERADGLPRPDALAAAAGLAHRKAARFAALAADLPAVHRRLALDPAEQDAADRFVQSLRDWIAANEAWAARSARYQATSAPELTAIGARP